MPKSETLPDNKVGHVTLLQASVDRHRDVGPGARNEGPQTQAGGGRQQRKAGPRTCPQNAQKVTTLPSCAKTSTPCSGDFYFLFFMILHLEFNDKAGDSPQKLR